jgi:hypothetical protein
LRTDSPPAVIIGTAAPTSVASKHLRRLTIEQVETSEFLRAGAKVVCVLILPTPALKRKPRADRVADWEVFTP